MSIADKTADGARWVFSDNARIETATESLAAYIGYLHNEIRIEKNKPEPNAGRIAVLEHQLNVLIDERHAFDPDNEAMVNRAIYVYAPFLKALSRTA